jgi:ketosteroid isomerase-like protein
MRKLLFLSQCVTLMFLALGHGSTAVAQTTEATVRNAQQEIKTLQGQLLQAILKSDTSVMEKHYSDDYIAIHGDGKLTTKAEEIEHFRSGVTKYDSITVREAKIRTYGDTAVVNTLASVTTLVNGKRFSGDVRNTRVWVKDSGNWKVVVFQTTRVAP